ncbi:MAG: rhomboid family intramembrane serine protease [Salibacteraceae bacterium]|jgi:membrane associated rhomboid family serine protease|nr:rhomboid family intramembrane serine protease [Salibacteraceae bacterium]MDP4686830.1 rhomboid family intramembrane serine protease [Salibacteraceae bacterium]MDP4762287.1 rhomboid family intramembrane serine protease [Salibacteraceae bacterium]MDP4844756.1 rhomboid family intramembrane serine protease [Salibacteraceae bacterium]
MTFPLIILAANVLLSVTCFYNRDLFYKLDFQPYEIDRKNEWYRFITHAFLHADFTHLAVNMYVLYYFGNSVFEAYDYYFQGNGLIYFGLLYLGGILFSAIPGYTQNRSNYAYHAVGASGAVSAVVYAFIVMFPFAEMNLMFIPIDFPAWVFGIGYLALEIYLDKNSKSNIAHSAHYFGGIYGLLLTIFLHPEFILKYF